MKKEMYIHDVGRGHGAVLPTLLLFYLAENQRNLHRGACHSFSEKEPVNEDEEEVNKNESTPPSC